MKYEVHWKYKGKPEPPYRMSELEKALYNIYKLAEMGEHELRSNIELHVLDGDEVVKKFSFNNLLFEYIVGSCTTDLDIITSKELNHNYKTLVTKLEQDDIDTHLDELFDDN